MPAAPEAAGDAAADAASDGAEVADAAEMTELADSATEDAPSDAAADSTTAADSPDATEPSDAPESGAGQEGEAADAEAAAGAEGGVNWAVAGLVLATVIVPIVLGNWLGNTLRMPEHSWKLATILVTFAAAALSIGLGDFNLGPDLAGGTTLIYELEDASQIVEDNADAGQAQPEQNTEKRSVSLRQMCDAIKLRVDPAGQKEVVIRPYGKAIEVIIPRTSDDDREFVKRQITDLGQLEFRITANPGWREDRGLIERALAAPPSQKLIKIGENAAGRWVPFREKEIAGDSRVVIRQTPTGPEALVKFDSYNVTGDYLTNASKGFDKGRPIVEFQFNAKGAERFKRFTGKNLPRPGSPAQRQLGILLNSELISAPNINEQIGGRGQISGGSMKEDEVDYVVDILNAGSLPAALNQTPLSETSVSPTLGKKAVEQASYAITVSLVAVLLFMVVYYRFAGVVACLALAANLLLVLGLMVMMGAAFTLPGMAGLVLTVGMSVDANVLIFERIREELARGAAMRMAIRNGFGRATTTIVDANVTTLIAGVVLYSVGTDTIKGFAVTLVLGVLMSMYTAIFCSRVIFDIAERRRWIKRLSFMSLVRKTSIDFLGKRRLAAAASIALIAVGLASVVGRGQGILSIDFTGGTSVTMALTKDNAMPFGDVDAALRGTILAEKELLVVKQGDTGTRYTINSNLAAGEEGEGSDADRDIVAETQAIIAGVFGDKLLTYCVDARPATPYGEGDAAGALVPVTFNEGDEFSETDGLTHDALQARVQRIVGSLGHNTTPEVENPEYKPGSSQRFKQWDLRLGGLDPTQADAVAAALTEELQSQPIFPLANKIGGKVAGDLQLLAIQAIVLSLLGIVGYVWFRFQNVAYGLAAVVALVHDVLVTLGAIAVSAYVLSAAPPVAAALQIDAFQISLPILAAFLTIIGYSLNDTIVVFDRIREVRGKSPNLTADMINTSVNQTLSRTLLTSLTTLVVVGILYAAGGPGIHGFAFALVVGVIVGTYSSIFIASPTLLAMAGAAESTKKVATKAA
ncbi:MAG: protein translocase subunit SecD [Planctomycetota bacterium]